VSGENRVAVRFVPPAAPEGIRQPHRKALDLPDRVSVAKLPVSSASKSV
jgi:hypothetical protein